MSRGTARIAGFSNYTIRHGETQTTSISSSCEAGGGRRRSHTHTGKIQLKSDPCPVPPWMSPPPPGPFGLMTGTVPRMAPGRCRWHGGSWQFPECPLDRPSQSSGGRGGSPAPGFLAHCRGFWSEPSVAIRHFQREEKKQSPSKPVKCVQKAACSPGTGLPPTRARKQRGAQVSPRHRADGDN